MNNAGKKPLQNTIAIIPARFNSTRLPGKALLEIAGKPMICWVAEHTLAAKSVSRVIVATDDRRILEVVRSEGYEAVETSSDHFTGTDRIAQVAEQMPDAEIIVNVQGDEPMISPETIDRAVQAIHVFSEGHEGGTQHAGIATTWEPIASVEDVLNPDVVKVIVNDNGRALYFSRAPVPFPRQAVREHGTIEAALKNDLSLLKLFRKHTGLYVYRREVLLELTRLPQTRLEQAESLEQLRALEHGVTICAIEATAPSIGVDTPADLERARKMMSESSLANA